jgi:hypothetical protein
MSPRNRFLLKLALFLLPAVAYLGFTVGLAWHAGEFTPLRKVAALQADSAPLLYGRAYRDNYFALKLVSAQLRKAEILVLGSSRAMQFRSELFSLKKEAFYNAGGAVQDVHEIREFLKALGDTALPRLLIVGLDQPWFNARTAHGFSRRRIQEQLDDENLVALNRAMSVGRYVMGDFLAGKIPLGRVLVRRDPFYGGGARGIAACARGSGFRNDGSYQYESVLNPDPVEVRMAEGYRRLREDVGHFSRGDSVAEESLAEAGALLRFCKERGIHVLGYAPPFAPGIADRMSAEGRHGYLAESARKLDSLFRAEGFSYGDFTDAAVLGAEDEDMVDAFHGSESVYLRLHLAMLESLPARFRGLVDEPALKQRVSQARANRLTTFHSPSR